GQSPRRGEVLRVDADAPPTWDTRVEDVRPGLTCIRARLGHVWLPADRIVHGLPELEVASEHAVRHVQRQVARAVDRLRPEAALVDAVLLSDALDLGRGQWAFIELVRLHLIESGLLVEVPLEVETSQVPRPRAAG